MKAIAIIQSRLNSKRLPAKAMLDLGGKPLIHRVIDRIEMAKEINEIWLATSTSPYDSVLENEGIQRGIKVYRGNLEDVLGRFVDVVKISKPQLVVRVTGDNPLTAPELIDGALRELINNQHLDYVTYRKTPYGGNVEAFTANALKKAAQEAKHASDREHVTTYIKNNPEVFNISYLTPPQPLIKPHITITLDNLDDYHYLYHIFSGFMKGRSDVPLAEVLKYIENDRN